ncbi:hypothetical protein NEUTE1DRAFT_100748 [Neurospora tetrasperma FGSC 2508]|uniref:DDT domain-containing protein n=1 Tax=Neurospora tetrasperma (strain FGSC 2508 / ATCC MYA-4615 / P0657) TaxID=510951 RepID=F8MMI8_NEUT8|nr:uncharacterized protein NEUTE1DRAFT_100748 [Neurospora tetrasperma FGSC 2508]EGO57862.1 hypothetical protein NEUTE1DRAFT_100748 [Neurospora tetrasperma FGSC 2508]
MVLFKRKPVQFLTVPNIEDDSQEVWHIPQTGEIFVTYEEYLNRMDFYNQTAGAAEVEQAFPEALKGPVLRRVQFQTVSRIDTLVDQIYDEFKNDYYPGETVTVSIDGEKLHGVVRDKTRFGGTVLPDGSTAPPYSRYFVSLKERQEEVPVNDSQIFRDRKVFTKSVLRSFIKKTVTREAWNGAPWLVKTDIAERYHIDTRIPPHLRYDNKLLERKQIQAQKRMTQPGGMGMEFNSHTSHNTPASPGQFSPTGPVRLPELKPAPKSHKSKAQQAAQAAAQEARQNGGVVSRKHNLFNGPEPGGAPEPPPPPPPPKYPIEDLQVESRGLVRPQLKYLCADPPVDLEPTFKAPFDGKILMKSVGPLLETWDTLNVYCEIFKLDSFTFDDFVEAMQLASEEMPVQLFNEIHCAVLKILVSSEADGGKVQIQLPELEEEDEEEEDEEDSAAATPEPESLPTARATRSSLAKLEAERLAAEAAAAEREMQEAEDAPKHRAEEVLKAYDWIEHLRKRDFKDGGWELIMVGLLHQLSKNERLNASCEELLEQLVPVEDEEPSRETVRARYASLDVNYRVQALQIICMLTAETKAIRGYMEDCSEQMTAYRKEKIEWQRKRKQALEDLKNLNDQRKILLPDNLPPSPQLEPAKVNGVNGAHTNGDVKMTDVDEISLTGGVHISDEIPDSDAEDADGTPTNGLRNLRRGNDRAAERKRKEEEKKQRAEAAAAAAKVPKQSKQFLKVLKDIQKKEDEIAECEKEIAIIDNDLREADCPRTRVLGKDRFWNRYYWFERNGMPYGGLPDSSTAHAGYANGCIWVQGPDELEREGYIDMKEEWQNEYVAKFGITVPERKKREEGGTSVFKATQWGFYERAEDVDKLLEWLDPRGVNETKLRKELVNYRDRIQKGMENRKTYVGLDTATEEEKKEENGVTGGDAMEGVEASTTAAVVEEPPVQPTTKGGRGKRSTRGNNNSRAATTTRQVTPEPPAYRCLAWVNTTAIEEIGHLHGEEPPPARNRKQSKKKQEAAAAKEEVEVQVAPTTRSGKKKSAR